MKIFWSWQSDTPAATGREFIKSAIADAIAQLVEELDLAEAERPELDHDTKDVPGLAPIADTIFDKIDGAALFVADITPTGATPDGKKKTPNPNVLIELGYALKALGPERIVLVANRSGGFQPEDLPFDLRHRRGPITYDLGPAADKDAKVKGKKALAKDLASAISANLGAFAQGPKVEPPQYPSIPGDRALWFDPAQPIGLHDTTTGKVQAGFPRTYLRVSSSGWTGAAPTRLEIDGKSIKPFGPLRNGSGSVPNDLGVLSGGWYGDVDDVTALTQWFDKTSEIWGATTAYGRARDDVRSLPTVALARQWRTRLKDWIALFDQLGARRPFRVEAGLVGIKGLEWPKEDFIGPKRCLEPEVVHIRSDKDWSDEAQLGFLTDVFAKICDAFAIERLTVDQVAAMST